MWRAITLVLMVASCSAASSSSVSIAAADMVDDCATCLESVCASYCASNGETSIACLRCKHAAGDGDYNDCLKTAPGIDGAICGKCTAAAPDCGANY